MNRLTMTALLITLLAAIPLAAAQSTGQDPADTTTLEGQVVRIEKAGPATDGGVTHRALIRTRNGEDVPVDLGPHGPCEGCLRVGDQVRVRAMHAGSDGAPWMARTMQVRRTGMTMHFRDANGAVLPGPRFGAGDAARGGIRERARDRIHQPGSPGGDGMRTRRRDRIHTPGTGGGAGGGPRHGGGGRR